MTLASDGLISGMPTTDGTYQFTVQVLDSGTLVQTATANESIQVVEPLVITNSPTLPNGCVNQPYSFAVQTTGGIAPFFWSFATDGFDNITLSPSGVFSGTPIVTGTFTGNLSVTDGTTHTSNQSVSVTVVQCP